MKGCEEVRVGRLRVLLAKRFEDAVHLSREIAERGDVVLLSPSCTSYDAFRNFEERGDTFCSIVKEWGSSSDM